ncbi:PREDICTED: uncharacterized protein LOC104808778 [Tarenaya hassleriana]|uniref:uncharacterized protein LOC104808778 n=1 Tax=Tarenaya hassleriana TaxID=28532 RepID=UPI00053C9B65|nr:PREDICTED: uncharacterized protein LOC104808778 [Tarenaya hassleriana]XP_010532877.1 PREDICTED: uncharacterized protein LOC104808778 [Tarenaya hassleriana]XP_010532879.1 PREDICTED: uncharacterized protein LOC104808778 [Tarenaya hassleriana]XP_010532880.1 PREDICTED: uncharacterized protein LOC104808778 [Tarenaya hassleriana]XP_019057542.1 PREDICTED: uncharacterized protein LOC104808778 [Tarenaya hassleriana]XP_019057543.1 PREDICTED: uncharacterized protein LOC104808778 [Tarenaya hassleriana]
MTGVKRKRCAESDAHALHKELDEVSCPICMDHPHNAVLLLCSSHDRGCRPYICDTSRRHSNCLDGVKKSQSESSDAATERSDFSFSDFFDRVFSPLRRILDSEAEGRLEIGDSVSLERERSEEESQRTNLKCPFCRGSVLGWKVVEEVRNYLDLKSRSCSRASCSFTGNYQELRRHARRVHPTTQPSDINPSREREWRRLEHQTEYEDIVSSVRSDMPGAVIVGDYVMENGDAFSTNGNTGTSWSRWWTSTVSLFEMMGSVDSEGFSVGHGGSRSRANRRSVRRDYAERRNLRWVNQMGLQDEHDNNGDDEDYAGPVPRWFRSDGRAR